VARRALTGVFLLDKPAGLSSTSALGRVKWLYQALRAGHTGTLDPFATGLLPICLGEATKFARFMLDADKAYRATLKLGIKTSTADTEGHIVATRDVHVDRDAVERVLQGFRGKGVQTPPMHSALKQDGVPLYKLARKGLEVAREERAIDVLQLELVSLACDALVLDCRVSKGTYIRVLAEDIGEALGCGAHLIGLRRTATAAFSLQDATTLEQLEAMDMPARDALLLPAERLCAALPPAILGAEDAHIFGNGGWVPSPQPGLQGEVGVYGPGGRFLGVGLAATAEARIEPVRCMARDQAAAAP